MNRRPNVLLIMNDDMGFSDIGCYGGEVETPNLDWLFQHGIGFTQFYNTARCSPSRASLLTGLHPHQTGVGILTEDYGPDGYSGNLGNQCVTIAEVLREHNYRTYMSGKWHIANNTVQPNGAWPLQRGFDKFYGTINGAGSYFAPLTLMRGNENVEHEAIADEHFYYTDAISDHAVSCIQEHQQNHVEQPFFQYVAYTAPHWPLHAPEEDISKYRGRFDVGWDQLRETRLKRLIESGIIEPSWDLSNRDPGVPAWEDIENKEWILRCMEVYAAQIDRMDQGIGKILNALRESEELDNTVILFLSDNGGCAEVIESNWGSGLVASGSAAERTKSGEKVLIGARPDWLPGAENSYQSYGLGWANLSNTPFRLYKHWVHEGGVATPFIVHWPNGIEDKGTLRHTPAQLTDIMATLLEITGASYPKYFHGHHIFPLEGQSLVSVFSEDRARTTPLFWEHEGNAAVRIDRWKLVRKYPGTWELYDMNEDRTELNDVKEKFPELVNDMKQRYAQWADRCGVIPRDNILNIIKERK